MIITSETSASELATLINERKEYYVFNYDKYDIDLYEPISFQYFGIRGFDDKLFEITFRVLGNDNISKAIYSSTNALAFGEHKEIALHPNKEECIINLGSKFVNRVMDVTSRDFNKENAYKFKKTYLEEWIERYPSLMI